MGSFSVERAVQLGALESRDATLQPPLAALPHMARVALSANEVADVRHGRAVRASDANDQAAIAALVDETASLVAIGERVNERWQPRMVLPNG